MRISHAFFFRSCNNAFCADPMIEILLFLVQIARARSTADLSCSQAVEFIVMVFSSWHGPMFAYVMPLFQFNPLSSFGRASLFSSWVLRAS